MNLTHRFAQLTPEKRPQDPNMDGTGLRFETIEHGGEYPDTMPQAIRLQDAEVEATGLAESEICLDADLRSDLSALTSDGISICAQDATLAVPSRRVQEEIAVFNNAVELRRCHQHFTVEARATSVRGGGSSRSGFGIDNFNGTMTLGLDLNKL